MFPLISSGVNNLLINKHYSNQSTIKSVGGLEKL